MTRYREDNSSGLRSQGQSPSNHIKKQDHMGTCFQWEAAFPEPFVTAVTEMVPQSGGHDYSRPCHIYRSQTANQCLSFASLHPWKLDPKARRVAKETIIQKPGAGALLVMQTAAVTEMCSLSLLFSEFCKHESYWQDQNYLWESGYRGSEGWGSDFPSLSGVGCVQEGGRA